MDHAAELNADAGRVVLIGFGLGAIPATLAPTNLADEEDEGDEGRVAGLAVLSGVFDLEAVRHTFLNAQLQIDQASAATHQPFRIVGSLPRPRPTVWLAVGEQETDEFHRNMVLFARVADDGGCPLSASTAKGHNHFSLLAELANPSSSITTELIAVFGAQDWS
ncbi:MAG: hypothetical protein CMM46_02390 [Rhodospirillaceae bacterium]|nr:hypothetical protein [Rhodospirillaceae bacterium]|tara:strand:- start:836 stop:1327 length:492 start_codon:yes stop_codon:yes gene_type:complete